MSYTVMRVPSISRPRPRLMILALIGYPRLSCLMQPRDHNTSGGPQAVRDTALGLDVLWLDSLEEKGARSPYPGGYARDENMPHTALGHGGATLPQRGSTATG